MTVEILRLLLEKGGIEANLMERNSSRPLPKADLTLMYSIFQRPVIIVFYMIRS
jgi:hypothetical protein